MDTIGTRIEERRSTDPNTKAVAKIIRSKRKL
jgi:hypothetical protein